MHFSHHHAPSHRAHVRDAGGWTGEAKRRLAMSDHGASLDGTTTHVSFVLGVVVQRSSTLNGHARRTPSESSSRERCRILERMEAQSVESEETP